MYLTIYYTIIKIVGIILIFSGIAKFIYPDSFSNILDIIFTSDSIFAFFHFAIPILELYLGFTLVLSSNNIYAIASAAALMVLFTLTAYFYRLSSSLECGCFGSFPKITFGGCFYFGNILIVLLIIFACGIKYWFQRIKLA